MVKGDKVTVGSVETTLFNLLLLLDRLTLNKLPRLLAPRVVGLQTIITQ